MRDRSDSAAALDSGSRMAWTVLLALMALTVLAYRPSLYGGFIFDDRFLVESRDIHVTTLHLGDWARAAWSQLGNNQFRALTMLTFAANYYLTGLDPFWFKMTNVCIHLVNGLLLFLMLRALFRLRAAVRPTDYLGTPQELAAAVIAGAWLLLPINLTGVAYVSQRVEALANVFVFLGLFWYLRERRKHFLGESRGTMLLVSIVACTALGYCGKESAILLPLYAACAEYAIAGFRNNDGKLSRPVLRCFAITLIVPFLLGLAWIATWVFHSIASFRTFSTYERLLTEMRVLVEYIGWTLLPNLNSLTFYHDDLAISHGLLDPPTTLLAIFGLAALLGLALWQRSTRPVFCLGVLWFFAGHTLTATVIPLELVFEHRNYFPSIGLILAGASLIALEPGLRRPAVLNLLAAGFLAFFAFTTFLRAEEWSHPLRLAYSEAIKRPESPRAQYELARALIIAAGQNEQSPVMDKSMDILHDLATRPDSGLLPLQALIYVSSHAGHDVDPRWWKAMIDRIDANPLSQSDTEAIALLVRCQRKGGCKKQTQEILDVYLAAMAKSPGNPYLMSAYSDFAANELGDLDLALRLAREVVTIKPQIPVYRASLARLQIAARDFEHAEDTIADLSAMSRMGSTDDFVEQLKSQLAAARASSHTANADADVHLPHPPANR